MSCKCCGAAGRTIRGCSCNGGKSHQCLRLASSSSEVVSSASSVVDEPSSLVDEPSVVELTGVVVSTISEPEAEPQPEVKQLLKTYIISMGNTDEAQKRKMKRGPLMEHEEYAQGFDYKDVPQHVIDLFHGRHRASCRESSIAALWSHIKLWCKLALENTGAYILEDDAIQKRAFDASLVEASESIVLLGGVLRTSTSWKDEQRDFIDSGDFIKQWDSLVVGLNGLGPRKFTNCIAYFMPAVQARIMVAHISIIMEDKVRKLRVPDVFMQKSPCNISLLFPNPYVEMDDCNSQCQSPKKDSKADLFLSIGMRNEVVKHGRCFNDMLDKYPHMEVTPLHAYLQCDYFVQVWIRCSWICYCLFD